jgi:hypothetical protein
LNDRARGKFGASSTLQVRKRVHFLYKMISLPRQAWDKHRKLPKKNTLFSRAGSTYHLDRPWDFNLFKPGADPGKKIASLVRHFILNMIVLPRQALDKHREKLKKRVPVFLIATGPSVISVVPYVGRVMIGKETPLLRHFAKTGSGQT